MKRIPFLVSMFLLLAGVGAAAAIGTAVGDASHLAVNGTPQTGNQLLEMAQYLGTVQFTCTDFTAAGTGACILDRDNTGAGQEALRIDVTDGTGTVIYTLSFQNSLGTYTAGLINTTPYNVAPVANPLTMTLTSLAGNGLPEEVSFSAQGYCSGIATPAAAIPVLSPWGVAALVLLLAAVAFVALRRRLAQ